MQFSQLIQVSPPSLYALLPSVMFGHSSSFQTLRVPTHFGWLVTNVNPVNFLCTDCRHQYIHPTVHCQFVTLNRLRCGQARCAESLYRWGVIASPACPSVESHQTTRHIVEECPLTAFPGGLRRLHEAGPDAVEWLSKLSMKL